MNLLLQKQEIWLAGDYLPGFQCLTVHHPQLPKYKRLRKTGEKDLVRKREMNIVAKETQCRTCDIIQALTFLHLTTDKTQTLCQAISWSNDQPLIYWAHLSALMSKNSMEKVITNPFLFPWKKKNVVKKTLFRSQTPLGLCPGGPAW